MNLIELALTTYTESKAMEADAAEDQSAQNQKEFLERARDCAKSTLVADAGALDWTYVSADRLPTSVEEARALVGSGRPEYLRYRVDYTVEDNPSFAFQLVQPCLVCGHDRISNVTSLFHLGQILNETAGTQPSHHEDGAEAGPLADAELLQARAARMLDLVHRLRNEHPKAGVSVDAVSAHGHADVDGGGRLRLKTNSAQAVSLVASSLGVRADVKVIDNRGSYTFRRATATATVGGIEIEVSGYTQLTSEEATAWRAQQDQAAEGGEG